MNFADGIEEHYCLSHNEVSTDAHVWLLQLRILQTL
jgi:hypothetical protein